MVSFISVAIVAFCISLAACDNGKCTNPEVQAETYSTKSLVLSTETVYIAEFSLNCKGGQQGLSLFAEVNGVLLPVSKSTEYEKYQLSWTSDHKKAQRGTINVRFFDEEGYASYRKTQRNEQDLSAVEPLFKIVFSHAGAGKDGFPVQTEFLSVVVALLVWFGSKTLKNKIMD